MPNSHSITAEIGAVYAGLETTGYGIEAFRQGSIAVRAHAQQQTPPLTLHQVITLTIETPSDNIAVEAARVNNPEEFTLGATVHAYSIRKGQQ